MFDPSKLDLNLENSEDQKKSEPSSWESEKIQSHKTTPIEEKNSDGDILDEILTNNSSEVKAENNISEKVPQKVETKSDIAEETSIKASTQTEEPISDNEDQTPEISYWNGWDNNYDKKTIQENAIKEEQVQHDEKEKIIFDINTKEIKDIFTKLIEQKYDFMTVEPFDEFIKLSFRKDKVEVEVINIKYPAYTQILIKAKTLTGLKVDESSKPQEWKWEYNWNTKAYKIISKTAPGNYGEKLFLKLEEIENKKVKTTKKSVWIWQIMGFLWAALFAAMIIWVWFLSFILLNATSVNQLEFFQNLWVDVWSIKEFTAQLVNIVFSIVVLIETLFLFTFIFKAALTKKIQKWLKIKRSIFAVFFLILTFITASLWMILSNKISDLRGQNYGQMITYDNSKYISPIFDEGGSVVATTKSFIWPVTLRFDISEKINQINNESNFKPNKVVWIINGKEIEKPINDTQLIQTFEEIELYDVQIRFEWVDLAWEEQILEDNLAQINVTNLINIEQSVFTWGGIWYIFDAENLRDLWKIEWYNIPDTSNLEENEANSIIAEALEKPTNTWYEFNSRILYDEELILGMKILSTWEDSNSAFDKVFIFSNDANQSDIQAEIIAEQDFNQDAYYTFRASDIETTMWNGYVSEFLWTIEDKTIRKTADLRDLESSSEVEFDFKTYGTYEIELEIIDTRWNSQTISKEITIEKKLFFSNGIFILNNKKPIENLSYDAALHEYIIDEVWVPTTLSLNAKSVRSTDRNYKLRNVEWDFGWDNDIDSREQSIEYETSVEWRHHIIAYFVFEHIKDPEKTISVVENIYIDGVKKESQIQFDIKKDNAYVPVTVAFDASTSQVKNENIVTFEWDYGDGVTEVRDAIVPGHKYTLAWDYDITLTVTTDTGKKYTSTQKLVLKPKPQTIEITASLKTAPVRQWIDFLSDESQWQITAYFWDFGDGNTSTQANPTHAYQKAWNYTVTLRLDFDNNNVLEEKVEIKIIED